MREGEDVVEFAHQVKRLVEKLTAMGMKLKLAKCKVGLYQDEDFGTPV